MKLKTNKLICWYLIGIFSVSLVIRGTLAYKIDQLGLEEGVRNHAADAPSFDSTGWQIAQGIPASQNWFSPGYTLFIALIYKIFGHHGLPVMLIQAIMGACTILFIFGLTHFLFGLPAAFISSGLAALSHLMINYSISYFSESPTIFFLSLFLLLMTKIFKNHWYLWVAGLCLGWASFFRMPVMLFSGLVFIWMLVFLKKKYSTIFLQGIIFVLLVYLPTSIITYRNYTFNNSLAIGTSYGQTLHIWSTYNSELHSLGFNPFSSLKKSTEVFLENPYNVLNLWSNKTASNLKKFFLDNNSGVIDLVFIHPNLLKDYQLIFQLSWIFPILGGYFGIKKYWAKEWDIRKPEVSIFTLMMFLLLYYSLLHSAFFYTINRFRMPVHFIILSLAGAGFWQIWTKIKYLKLKNQT